MVATFLVAATAFATMRFFMLGSRKKKLIIIKKQHFH
jgi:hypothetical protein